MITPELIKELLNLIPGTNIQKAAVFGVSKESISAWKRNGLKREKEVNNFLNKFKNIEIDFLDPVEIKHYILTDFWQEDLENSIDRILKTIPEREEKIIRMTFGIGESKKNLLECSNVIGLTIERTRQVGLRGLRRLRHPIRSHQLRDFY